MTETSLSDQLEYADRSVRTLRRAADRLTDDLERLHRRIAAAREGGERKKEAEPGQSPCTLCPNYDTCSKPCDELEALLPSPHQGRLFMNGQRGLPLHVIQHQQVCPIHDSRDVFERFEGCRHLLSDARWEVVELVYGEGLTQREAAQELGKRESTVSELLTGARKVMEQYYARDGSVRRDGNAADS